MNIEICWRSWPPSIWTSHPVSAVYQSQHLVVKSRSGCLMSSLTVSVSYMSKVAPLTDYSGVNQVPVYAQAKGQQAPRRIVLTVPCLPLTNGQEGSEWRLWEPKRVCIPGRKYSVDNLFFSRAAGEMQVCLGVITVPVSALLSKDHKICYSKLQHTNQRL